MDGKKRCKSERISCKEIKNAPCPEKEKQISGRDALAVRMHGEKISDVLGSYTGNPKYDDEPVQDADDL